MAQVCVMHGIVSGFETKRMTHRGLFDRQAFVDYLKQRPRPFVPLAAVLDGDEGAQALTVDDATYASADAAVIARELGHAVTLFVNAEYIAHGRAHYFSVLNAILDRANVNTLPWEGRDYDVTRPRSRADLRRALKGHLQTLADDEARFAALRDLAARLAVDDVSVPPHLRTLTRADVSALIAQGVDIQNHGWTHAEMSRLPASAQRDEIVKGREWLETTFGLRVTAYAVPFGTPQPEPALRDTLQETWFCANDAWTSGPLAPGVWNRVSLNLLGSAWKGAPVKAGGAA